MDDDFEKQLEQVNRLLAKEPHNVEYQEMAKQLREVIQLAKQVDVDLDDAEDQDQQQHLQQHEEQGEQQHEEDEEDEEEEAHETMAIGTKVQAVWSEDGEWYNGTIRAVTPNGYLVMYDGWNNEEEVDAANIRQVNLDDDKLVEAEREAEATRQAIKRKIALAADVGVVPRDLPQKLKIKPDDPEEIRQVKKKKIHAFKSKLRLEQMEVAQNKRQNAWQQFQTAKGKSKKVGFFTGRKKESIFKSPDDPRGKVGVTGSGKGITEFQKREKHLHLKLGVEGEVDE
ncbi:survival of motor neuron-related-splicing factor 30 isoform X4 [Selaginella moellendorffii]|uniref:survival of motor neuron-related-splicing factor 30 isoform X2 n=1 Tax=Selaginella moellendorffii TaxID=88036 RepID=UPI000D1C61A2|nr:survival of motor neuron-related-splicing factor 30 isoform X2 [Selaginella moellendorffii]XP_024529924.1 survival of motor neuron-related-splicing factor 30 isoform X4 [Selaginella moellendorffii]|eukprot:XP_024516439.1 survival of motor neuron-related-splicing factor 30 isoform X2 [Selaginella moellendorffii]